MWRIRDPSDMYRKAQKSCTFGIIYCYLNVLTLRNKVDNVGCYIYANVYKNMLKKFSITCCQTLLHLTGKHKFKLMTELKHQALRFIILFHYVHYII